MTPERKYEVLREASKFFIKQEDIINARRILRYMKQYKLGTSLDERLGDIKELIKLSKKQGKQSLRKSLLTNLAETYTSQYWYNPLREEKILAHLRNPRLLGGKTK
jgi:hypothetical protein